jgi:hypothetical protein
MRGVSSHVSDADDGHLHVQGELLGAGDRVALELRPAMRQVDDQIEVDASTRVDQRQLGMTWSPLGMARTPTVVTVHAHLRPQRWARRISVAPAEPVPSTDSS